MSLGVDFTALLLEYRYCFFFVGMFLGGEIVLLPAIFLSLQGVLNPAVIIIIGLIADLLSDTAWYSAGRFLPFSKVGHFKVVRRGQKIFSLLVSLFDRCPFQVVFWSKFVYGTRILTQVVSGVKKLPYVKYIVWNSFGFSAYLAFLFALAVLVNESLGIFLETVRYAKALIFLMFILVAILINLWIRELVLKRWSPP